MKLTKQTAEYSRYDLETTPPTMVIVSREGIITFVQNEQTVVITKGELKCLVNGIQIK